MYENNEDGPAPDSIPQNFRASVQRGSHVWTNSKRNFIEDPEFEKLKQSIARPEQVNRLRNRN